MSGATGQPGLAPPTPRRRRIVAACVVVGMLVLAAGAGAAWWLGVGLPQPPAVDASGREPEIASAIAAARAEVQRQPRSGKAWGRLGLLLLAHDYEPEARVCLARAEQLDPKDPRWPYLTGRLVEAADPEAALPLLRRAADLAHDTTVPRLHLAETLLALGHTDEAAAEFRRVLDEDPANPRAGLGLGRLAYLEGDLDTACARVGKAAAVLPRLRCAHALLAEILRRRGDSKGEEREMALLPRCEEQEWPDPYLAEVSQQQVGSPARVARAERLLEEGRQAEAVALLQETVRAAPESFRARLLLGRQLAARGDAAGAEEQLQAALKVRPDSFEALSELGEVLQRQEKFDDAADCYRRVLALRPENASAHFHLAACQERLGDRPGAIASLRTALRCKPEFAAAHKALGRLLAEAGRDAEAADQVRDALRLAPDDTEARVLLAQVQARRGGSGKTTGK